MQNIQHVDIYPKCLSSISSDSNTIFSILIDSPRLKIVRKALFDKAMKIDNAAIGKYNPGMTLTIGIGYTGDKYPDNGWLSEIHKEMCTMGLDIY